jgi:hypothetical protein
MEAPDEVAVPWNEGAHTYRWCFALGQVEASPNDSIFEYAEQINFVLSYLNVAG